MTGKSATIEVHLVDKITSNPYLQLFQEALTAAGVAVARREFASIAFEQVGDGVRVLHLHWPYTLYSAESRGEQESKLKAVINILRCARRLGWKIVWTVHNVIRHDPIFVETENAAVAEFVAISDQLICHCETSAKTMTHRFGAARSSITVAPHPHFADAYPAPPTRSVAREQLGLHQSRFILLAFGMVRGYKGLTSLINLMSAGVSPDYLLIVAGEPGRGADVADLVRRAGHRPNMMLKFEHIPSETVSVLFAAANAAVLPYRDVTTSGVAVLAHSLGRAVIAPHTGCLPEDIPPGTGILYPPGCRAGLEQAIKSLTWESADEMGRTGRSNILTRTWGNMAKTLIDVYGKVSVPT